MKSLTLYLTLPDGSRSRPIHILRDAHGNPHMAPSSRAQGDPMTPEEAEECMEYLIRSIDGAVVEIKEWKHPLIRMPHWTNRGTGLTNFRPEMENIYLAAIEALGSPNYVIVREPMQGSPAKGYYSLHQLKREDASSFWRKFREVREHLETPNP